MRIALVAFKGTIAQRVALLCAGLDGFEVASSQKAVVALAESGQLDNYDRIVAMGLKNGSKDNYVHVEGFCYSNGSKHRLDTSLADGSMFKQTILPPNLEKSYCNTLAAALKNKYPNKAVEFLHIPPRLNVADVAAALMASVNTWE